MDIQQLFTRTNTALNDVVQQLTPEQLDSVSLPSYATSNQGRSLRTFVNVCAYENDCVPAMLEGKKGLVANQENTTDYLQDDFKSNFARLVEVANEAVRACSQDDLARTVHMSYMDAPARDYLNDIVLQRSLAAIDIAQAANLPHAWDNELLQGLWDTVAPNANMLREYGVFPAEVVVGADASLQDKLLGLMGRNPRS